MNTNLSMNNIVDWTITSDLVGNVKVDQVGVLDRVSSLATRSIKRESKLDALEKINAGASLIQLYTGFIYEGPALIKKINKLLLK